MEHLWPKEPLCDEPQEELLSGRSALLLNRKTTLAGRCVRTALHRDTSPTGFPRLSGPTKEPTSIARPRCAAPTCSILQPAGTVCGGLRSGPPKVNPRVPKLPPKVAEPSRHSAVYSRLLATQSNTRRCVCFPAQACIPTRLVMRRYRRRLPARSRCVTQEPVPRLIQGRANAQPRCPKLNCPG